MSKNSRTPEEVAESNAKHFVEHGPGLSKSFGTFTLGRDRKHGCMLIGGLGGLGLGQAWMQDNEAYNKDRAGCDEAPEMEAPKEFWKHE